MRSVGLRWKLEFFQFKVATLPVEEVVGFALQAGFGFLSGSGLVIRESHLQRNSHPRWKAEPVLARWGEGGARLAMTHLLLEQILREDVPICQGAAKRWGLSQEGDSKVTAPHNFQPRGRWTESKPRSKYQGESGAGGPGQLMGEAMHSSEVSLNPSPAIY